MGCFSFICQKSGKPVLSSSFSGDAVHLFLLKNGKVIEYMYGNYDSYGSVFNSEQFDNSFEWKMEWGEVCDLMFDNDKSNGIAAILAPFWKEGNPYPTERSKDDPNQGWGKHMKLIGSTSKEIGKPVKEPYHKILNNEI